MKLFVALLFVLKVLSAQSFEVASVREITDAATLQAIKSGEITYKNGDLKMNGVTLGYAVQWAYNIQNFQLDGPDWIHWRPSNDQPRYNLVAKTNPDISNAKARVMAQRLLAERFGLKAHFEDRMKPGYTLRESPQGLKIERIEPTDVNPLMTYDKTEGKVRFLNMNIAELCGDVALTIREPVVDGTALGKQTFNASAVVRWERPDEIASALFAGLKDIGLVAVRERVSVKTVVVDHIEQHPTDN